MNHYVAKCDLPRNQLLNWLISYTMDGGRSTTHAVIKNYDEMQQIFDRIVATPHTPNLIAVRIVDYETGEVYFSHSFKEDA